jgi:hypothetical protein
MAGGCRCEVRMSGGEGLEAKIDPHPSQAACFHPPGYMPGALALGCEML